MKTEVTKDADIIKLILCHPAIYATIGGDKAPLPEQFEPPISDDFEYLAGYVDDQPMALMVYHFLPDKTKVHVQVLPEFRKSHSRDFGRAAMAHGSQYGTLHADIPVCYPNVVLFAKQNGFKETGIRQWSYSKGGLLWNVLEMRAN